MAIPRWLTRRRLVIGSVAVIALAVIVLGPRRSGCEGCCICGIKRDASYFLGLRYWSKVTEISGDPGLHDWYVSHIGQPHCHHWHTISGTVSFLGRGLIYCGTEPASVLYALAKYEQLIATEKYETLLAEYALVDGHAQMRAFHEKLRAARASNPRIEPDAARPSEGDASESE